VPLSLEAVVRLRRILNVLFISLFLLVWALPGLSQKAHPDGSLLKYDLHTEMKANGVIDEVNQLTVGPRKDFTELIIKNGEDRLHIYVSPKPYQDEIGVSFNKGDHVAVTGSKVKQDVSEVILVRELIKGTDTLMFRDDKGNPAWDWRTGK